MRNKILAAFAVLALSSCSNPASDGYRFEQDSKLISPREIKVVLHSDMVDLRSSYARNHSAKALPETRELQAYSVINATTCTIHMVDPKTTYMPEFVGHELVHCLYGEFHPTQNG